MPSLNFDYTQFLKRQNATYLLQYQNDPIEVAENPAPVIGYSGHVPSYRTSIHDQRMVRSLVRSLTSPMKPTTATGYLTSKNILPEVPKSPTTKTNSEKLKPSTKEETKPLNDSSTSKSETKRAQSAPPAPLTHATKKRESPNLTTPLKSTRLNPSQISMMSAGSASSLYRSRPCTNSSHSVRSSGKEHLRPHSNVSSVAFRPITRNNVPVHPTGYSQTLYGNSYWYAWPDEDTYKDIPSHRPESYQRDHKLGRNDDVIYHKHEGVVPKYMGYVPGYKFRHGATYGVLTVHARPTGYTKV